MLESYHYVLHNAKHDKNLLVRAARFYSRCFSYAFIFVAQLVFLTVEFIHYYKFIYK